MAEDRYRPARHALNAFTSAAALLPAGAAAAEGPLEMLALGPVAAMVFGLPAALANGAERDFGRRPTGLVAGSVHRLSPLYAGVLAVLVLSLPAVGTPVIALLVTGEALTLAFARLPRIHGLHFLNATAIVAGGLAVRGDAWPLALPFLVLLATSLAVLHFETKRRRASEPIPRAPDDLATPIRTGAAIGPGLAALFSALVLVAPADLPRPDVARLADRASNEGPPAPPVETGPGSGSLGRMVRLVLGLAAIAGVLYGYHRYMQRFRKGQEAPVVDERVDAPDVEIQSVERPRAPAVPAEPPDDARARVVAEYVRFTSALERRDLGRRPEEAPAEHAASLARRVPDAAADIADLLERFHRARYGAAPVEDGEALHARERAERVLARVVAAQAARSDEGPASS